MTVLATSALFGALASSASIVAFADDDGVENRARFGESGTRRLKNAKKTTKKVAKKIAKKIAKKCGGGGGVGCETTGGGDGDDDDDPDDDLTDPPVLPGPCDDPVPTRGSVCEFGADRTCYAEHSVRGCSPDALVCSPGAFYVCSERGLWEKAIIDWDDRECAPGDDDDHVDDDPLLGAPCSPLGCPPSKPPAGERCAGMFASDDDDDDGVCYYDHRVLGCTPDSLACTPTASFRCGEDGGWVEDPLFFPACIADDPRWNDPCSPLVFLGCPTGKPTPGERCAGKADDGDDDGSCYYDHRFLGCTPETLRCVGTSAFRCESSGLWSEEAVFLPECIADDPRWGTVCEPGVIGT